MSHTGDDPYPQLIHQIRGYAIFTMDPEGVITSWNEGVERILGYRRDEFVGRPGSFLFTPEDRARGAPERELDEAARSGHVEDDRWHERKDGARVWIDGSVDVLRGDAGEIRGFVKVMRDASERRRAEEALRARIEEAEQARRETEAVLQQMPAGVLIAEAPSGRLVLGNEQVERIWRRPLAEMTGIGEYRGFHRDGTPYEPEAWPLARSLRTGEVVRGEEIVIERGDGTRGAVSVNSAPIRDREGRITAAIAVFDDVTPRMEVEEELQGERDFLEAILDTLSEAIVVTDADGYLLRFNRAARELHGLPAESIPADDWAERYDLFAADGRTPLRKEDVPLYRALQGEVVRDVEMAIRPVGREARILSANGQLITAPGGETVGAVVAMHDITEGKRAEEALQESEARQRFLAEAGRRLVASLDYEATLDNVAHLVVPAIADWCVIDVLGEDGALEQVALAHVDPSKEAWGHELRRRYPANPEATTGAFHAIRTGKGQVLPEISDDLLQEVAWDAEHLELLRKVGMRAAIIVPLAVRERPFGAITLIAAESERTYGPADLELAEELARRAAIAVENARLYGEAQSLNEELESRVEQRTADLEAAIRELETFAYSVSHDLRAPLRGIDGFSQALVEDYRDILDDTGRTYLQRIRAGAQRMGELIDDLLDFSRLSRSEIRRSPVDLGDVATSIARKLQEGRPDRAAGFEIARGVEAQGDERLLRIALENLLGNAWKFTQERERTEIAFGVETIDGRPVYFVRDNGAGFDMQYAGKLFTPFQRLHSPGRFEGTGIGLATVQRIIHRHGGRIWAEGRIGEGATFFFTLPPAAEDEEGEA